MTARWVPTAPTPQPSTASAASAVAAVAAPLSVTTTLTLPNSFSLQPHLTEASAKQIIDMLASNAAPTVSEDKLKAMFEHEMTKVEKKIPIYDHLAPIAFTEVFKFADKAPIMHCSELVQGKKTHPHAYVVFVQFTDLGQHAFLFHFEYGTKAIVKHTLSPSSTQLGDCTRRADLSALDDLFQGKNEHISLYYPTSVAAATAASTAAAASAKPVGLESRIRGLITNSGKQIAIYEHSEHIMLTDVFQYADKAPIMHCCNGLSSAGEGYMLFVTIINSGTLHGFYYHSGPNSEDALSHLISPKDTIMPRDLTIKDLQWGKWLEIFAGNDTMYALYYPATTAAVTTASTLAAASAKPQAKK